MTANATTIAITYAESGSDGFGVDVVTTFPADEFGMVDADWAWTADRQARSWSTEQADQLLATLGWVRDGDWEQQDAIVDAGPGWTAPIRRV